EQLVEVAASDPATLIRLAWHIGNRHLPAQLEPHRILIREDAVIEHMLVGLGASIKHVLAAFTPESGAYDSANHGNSGPAHTLAPDHAHSQGDHAHPHDSVRAHSQDDHAHPHDSVHAHSHGDHAHPHDSVHAHSQDDHAHPHDSVHAHSQDDHAHPHGDHTHDHSHGGPRHD